MAKADTALRALIDAIASGDTATVLRTLAASPGLATAQIEGGATRASPKDDFLEEIFHYVYAGDTALHLAAAAHRVVPVRKLLASGAKVSVRNRRGAQPLHYAVDGGPNLPGWSPARQRATVESLLAAGADPNGIDKGGVTPLHRAVRNRCAAAVEALLEGGADARRTNGSGSTPLQLAAWTTGRGGTGSAAAREQQEEIVGILERHLSSR
jgi:hypothetical protein